MLYKTKLIIWIRKTCNIYKENQQTIHIYYYCLWKILTFHKSSQDNHFIKYSTMRRMTYIKKILTSTNMQILLLTPTKMQILCLTPKTSNIVQVNLHLSFIIWIFISKKNYIVIIDIVIILKNIYNMFIYIK